MNGKIEVCLGDITKLEIDAIVNAANHTLLGGGGVDGAIHKAAGSGLQRECRQLGQCPEGQARLTEGHRLPAKYVIHAVGPKDKKNGAALISAYINSLEIARESNIRTIAFPCIATGIYGFPRRDAANLVGNAIRTWLMIPQNAEKIDKIIFCLFTSEDQQIYAEALYYWFPLSKLTQEGSWEEKQVMSQCWPNMDSTGSQRTYKGPKEGKK